ncbi:hypothetical protein [Pseudomonas farris]
MTHYIVFGSWKVRHNEPLRAHEKSLRLYAHDAIDSREHSIYLDLRTRYTDCLELHEGTLAEKHFSVDEVLENMSENVLPLAIVSGTDNQWTISHLTTRLEKHVTHLIKVPDGSIAATSDNLLSQLTDAFDSHHIKMNNFECFYIKGMPDTELEQKFDIKGEYDYHLLNKLWYAALDSGELKGLAPQLGDEIEHWSYDNDFCKILPNAEKMAGYLSIMHWSRLKKTNWDQPVVTFKKKLYDEDALERWERNYAGQFIEGTPEESLARYFKLPLWTLPSWRRTRYDIACEVLATGNIFMVNFEDSRVRDDRSESGRLQQCEIEYLKTRGTPDEACIYKDLEEVSRQVEAFMSNFGLSAERSNYSKLTFLENYVAVKGLSNPDLSEVSS